MENNQVGRGMKKRKPGQTMALRYLGLKPSPTASSHVKTGTWLHFFQPVSFISKKGYYCQHPDSFSEASRNISCQNGAELHVHGYCDVISLGARHQTATRKRSWASGASSRMHQTNKERSPFNVEILWNSRYPPSPATDDILEERKGATCS